MVRRTFLRDHSRHAQRRPGRDLQRNTFVVSPMAKVEHLTDGVPPANLLPWLQEFRGSKFGGQDETRRIYRL
jgi:hypothetical protein